MLVLNASLTTTLRFNTSSIYWNDLNEDCRTASSSIIINMTIMPENIPEQSTYILVNAQNNGNLITALSKEDNMTVMLQYFKDNDY